MIEKMEEVNKKCPDITYVYDVTGKDGLPFETPGGNTLTVIVFSDNPDIHEKGNLACFTLKIHMSAVVSAQF